MKLYHFLFVTGTVGVRDLTAHSPVISATGLRGSFKFTSIFLKRRVFGGPAKGESRTMGSKGDMLRRYSLFCCGTKKPTSGHQLFHNFSKTMKGDKQWLSMG